jgi:hypothetical protein
MVGIGGTGLGSRIRTLAEWRTALLYAWALLAPIEMGCWLTESVTNLRTLDGGESPDASSEPPVTYHDLTTLEQWETFDLSTLDKDARAFVGGVFDGRYVYLVPNGGVVDSTLVVRFDTMSARLSDPSAWSTFVVARATGGTYGFAGGLFDGQYAYFIPSIHLGCGCGSTGIGSRYDVRASSLSDPTAWTSFNVPTGSSSDGYLGGAFDGRVLYLAGGSHVARYDPRDDIQTGWNSIDTASSIDPRAFGLVGAACDGHFVYFAPYGGYDSADGFALQHDTSAILGSGWKGFDAATLKAGSAANATGFNGAVFDGRYLYLVPGAQAMRGFVFARYDTTARFDDPAAWSTFDLTVTHPAAIGYAGGTFDGRFVYFAPNCNGINGCHGLASRYDSTARFEDTSAWTTVDLSSLSPDAQGFFGAVFDGTHVYFIPFNGSTIARFDARTPPLAPRPLASSFL